MHVSTLYNPGKIRDKLPQLTAKARVIKIKSSSPPPDVHELHFPYKGQRYARNSCEA